MNYPGKRNQLDTLKLVWVAMIPFLAGLLDIAMNNNAIPCDWIKAILVPIYEGGDRSVVENYRSVSLNSVVWPKMEQGLAGT